MATTDIQTLLSYESFIEPAWISLLAAEGLTAAQEFSEQFDADGNLIGKVTPFVDVLLTNVIPTGHKRIVTSLPAGADGQFPEMYDAWSGQLVSKVVTVRGRNSAQQAPMLGLIRMIAQQSYTRFNETNLPYHAVGMLKESGLTRGVELEQSLDWSELRHTIFFNILPGALPA
jgi:hypothetical protein